MDPLSIYYDIQGFDSESQIVFRALMVIPQTHSQLKESSTKFMELFKDLKKYLISIESSYGHRITLQVLSDNENQTIIEIIYDGRLNLYVSYFLAAFGEEDFDGPVFVSNIPNQIIRRADKLLFLKEKQLDHRMNVLNLDEQLTIKGVPLGLVQKLALHQKEGVLQLVKNKRMLLGDEMGLGKTIQALAFVSACLSSFSNRIQQVLVIAPAGLLSNWENEIRKHLSTPFQEAFRDTNLYININCTPGDLGNSIQQRKGSHVIFSLLSYEMAQKEEYLNDISRTLFTAVIVDECHYMKNKNTERFHKLGKVLSEMENILLLTGTPIMNSISDLGTLLAILAPEDGMTNHLFNKRYVCEGMVGKHMAELKAMFLDSKLLRRTNAEVCDKDQNWQRPPDMKRYLIALVKNDSTKLTTSMNALVKNDSTKLTTSMNNDDINTCMDDEEEENPLIFNQFNWEHLAKIPALVDYIKKVVVSEKVKSCIFVHHQVIIEAIEDMLRDNNIKFVVLDGNTNQGDKTNEYVNAFQTNKDYQAAIVSITAAGVGLSLTAAERLIFGELYWSYGWMAQCEARSYRFGQKNSIRSDWVVSYPSSFDNEMLNRILRKKYINDFLFPKANDGNFFTNIEINKYPSDTNEKQKPENFNEFIIWNHFRKIVEKSFSSALVSSNNSEKMDIEGSSV